MVIFTVHRFFWSKNRQRDDRPKKLVSTCSSYSTSAAAKEGIPVLGFWWAICTTESHGTSRIGGQVFYPGLYENRTYFRIPAHRNILPELNPRGTCVICESHFQHGIRIQEVSHFCCNKHYLEWWRTRNPEMFEKLNKNWANYPDVIMEKEWFQGAKYRHLQRNPQNILKYFHNSYQNSTL